MFLREYQKKLITEIYSAWETSQNVLMQLPTGGGKTHLFCKIIADHPGITCVIAHRIEILGQISLTLARHGVYHRLITQSQKIRETVSLHLQELKKSYFEANSRVIVIGVDTLIKLKASWFQKVSLVVQDEAHHVLRDNKWGKAAALFPNARGLYPTATPCRADGRGLGRHADGIIDALVVGESMRSLINQEFLTDYTIFSSRSDVNLSDVPVTAGGDYSAPKLRAAVHKSHITGDVVAHYLKYAPGKLGITFAVDVKAATDIAAEYRAHGVPAEVITSKTPDLLRASLMRRFKNREILQLVNVDLLGEGVDVPAIEVVSMARPTQSYSLYAQQFGRALRPLPGKTHAIIIDHVDNVIRHGLPDSVYRTWTLDRRERRNRGASSIPLTTCLRCIRVYERIQSRCPYCQFKPEPVSRASVEYVDGDLSELSPEVLKKMRGEIARIDDSPKIPAHLDYPAQLSLTKKHKERQIKQEILRNAIAQWAGCQKAKGYKDAQIHKLFYFLFEIDILTAQTLGAREAAELTEKINDHYSLRN